MTDEQFRNLCNVYGFAPSRSLRELLDSATAQAVISEREACAKVCEMTYEGAFEGVRPCFETPDQCAAAIRARAQS
jgi:hypothetical protein